LLKVSGLLLWSLIHLSSRIQATNVGEDVVKQELLYTADGNVNYYNYYGNQYGDSLKK
jgi:hypothetical protein